jgi:hypothetical protein
MAPRDNAVETCANHFWITAYPLLVLSHDPGESGPILRLGCE